MFRGFGKPQRLEVKSLVALQSLEGAVQVTWGKARIQFTPAEARAHAFSIMQAAAAASLDACLVQWAVDKLGQTPQAASQLLQLFRAKRAGTPPSCTLRLGDEHIRPDTARQRAQILLDAAFGTESEAWLALFLLEELEQPGEKVDMLLQEFRELRGAMTLWQETSTEEGEGDGW